MYMRLKHDWFVENINVFVEQFKCEKEFKELTGKSIKKWDYKRFDSEVIQDLLDKIDGKYFCTYDEEADGFYIYEFK